MSDEERLREVRTSGSGTTARPNILLITSDQQRADVVGPAAPSFMMTPHFDLLCREGITFSRAYAQSPLCVPSRVSIMTGLSPFTHGMVTNGETSRVIDRLTSLPARLHALGYQTAAIGKMHFGPQRARHGFDEMILPEDYYLAMDSSGYALRPMRHGLGQNEFYPGMATVPEALTLTAWIADQAARYIRDRRDPTVPFFLWVSFSKPHPPLDPPEPYASMYKQAAIPEPFVGHWRDSQACPPAFWKYQVKQGYDTLSPEVIRAARVAYYGLITQIDYSMGRVLSALQDLSLLDDTCILYTSDHGEFLGDHRAAQKSFFYEPSAHIPMVLRLPQTYADRHAGETCAALVTHSDIMSTFLDVAGADCPSDLDTDQSRSLWGMARRSIPWRSRIEGTCYDAAVAREGVPMYYALLQDHWKYIWYPDGGIEQLFDIAADPHEITNLAGDPGYDSTLQEMHSVAVDSQQAAAVGLTGAGGLVAQDRDDSTEAFWRNLGWPGLHTERYPIDVRH